jgi:hypothetical protein
MFFLAWVQFCNGFFLSSIFVTPPTFRLFTGLGHREKKKGLETPAFFNVGKDAKFM